MDGQYWFCFPLIQSLITPLTNVPSVVWVLWVGLRSLLWLIDQLFISINSHVSWHPYQFNPVMFCLSYQGMMAFPG
jgi:hypothetical protein